MKRGPLAEQEVDDWNNAFNQSNNRAPVAVAVATIVMGAGALFLANIKQDPLTQSSLPQTNTVIVGGTAAPLTSSNTSHATDNTKDAIVMASEATDSEKVLTSIQSESEPLISQNSSPAQLAILTTASNTDPQTFIPRLNPRRAAKQATLPPANRGFWPRLKPNSQIPTTETNAENQIATPVVSVSTRRPMSFGGFAIPRETDNPPRVFFQADLRRDRTPPPPLAIAMATDIETIPTEVTVKLTRGETFVDALRRVGVTASDRNNAAASFGKVQNLRKLRPGQEFILTTARPNQTLFQAASSDAKPALHLLDLTFRPDAQNKINLARSTSGEFQASKTSIPLTTRLASITGRIEGSLFVSAKKAGAPNQVIGNLANMFAYDVDFQRDIFGGDEFEAIFEILYDNQGNIVGAGDILYGRLKWRGRTKEKGYYRFAVNGEGQKTDFYDRAGQSAKRLLMKTPIDGARLSSGFGTRKHPILGYRKAHKGVDFAARRGTPVYAAGDGVIERANRFGSFGNYIRIKHANGYKTAYAHLKGFRKGIRAGKRVSQGDVIGYVGTTGRSTGPHLHYEVHRRGKAVNPQRLKIATGTQLKKAKLSQFKIIRDEIDAMRTPSEKSEALYAEEEAAKGKSL